jgi:hypothetical protein
MKRPKDQAASPEIGAIRLVKSGPEAKQLRKHAGT